MSELKRWTDDGAPEAIERLLRAAESEVPTEASLASTLTSLGVVAGATSLTTGAAASGGADAAGLSGAGATLIGAAAAPAKLSALALTASLAKWIALGSVVGGTVVAVGAITNEAPPPPSARAPLTQPASPPPAAVDRRSAPEMSAASPSAASPTAAGPSAGTASAASSNAAGSSAGTASAGTASAATAGNAELAASPETARGAATSASTPRAPSGAAARTERAHVSEAVTALPAETLAAEIAGIDRARSLLAAGSNSRAVAALDDYERRFPKNHFAPEVLYLRMEAASRAGHADEARRFARQLLARYPTSPQSEKARHLLDQKIE